MIKLTITPAIALASICGFTTPSCLYAAPPIAQSAGALSAAEKQEIVNFHNRARAEVGVGPVKWSDTLAASAQNWANNLARTGRHDHSPTRMGSPGENLAWGSGPSYKAMSGVEYWYNEKKDYAPGDRSPYRNFGQVGHYTQMVWRSTTEIGLATSRMPNGDLMIVCHYNPAGNMQGEAPYGAGSQPAQAAPTSPGGQPASQPPATGQGKFGQRLADRLRQRMQGGQGSASGGTPGGGIPAAGSAPSAGAVAGAIDFQKPNYDAINQAIIKETNARRAQNGLPALAYSKQLTDAAQSHSNDMVRMNFFSHDNPYDGNRRSMDQRIALTGYKAGDMAENIAETSAIQYKAGTSVQFGPPGQVMLNGAVVPNHTPQTLAKELLDTWMNSSGHRRNILSSNTELGTGVAFFRDGSLNNTMIAKATQVFGMPAGGSTAPPMTQPATQPTQPKSSPSSKQNPFPQGYFHLTNKAAERQGLVMESAPVSLRKKGGYTGMLWKAIPAGNGYYYLTSQYLEGQNQVLEGYDGSGPAEMVENKGYSGTLWKPLSAGGGYYYLTSAYMQSQKKVLEGNVGDINASSSTTFQGLPYMTTSYGDGTKWKFTPAQ